MFTCFLTGIPFPRDEVRAERKCYKVKSKIQEKKRGSQNIIGTGPHFKLDTQIHSYTDTNIKLDTKIHIHICVRSHFKPCILYTQIHR